MARTVLLPTRLFSGGRPTGLDFPGNVDHPSDSPPIKFVFNNTISGTTPFAPYPATYIWRAYPRDQDGYWTFLFHSDYESFPFVGATKYYGMHPYPDPPETGAPKWEISSHGTDELGALTSFNQWFINVAITYVEDSTEYHEYYWNWPNTTTDKVLKNGALKSAAPDPAIIVGDAPWNPGREVPNAILRGFQFYDARLTLAQAAQEVNQPGSYRTPWYLNLNPTPTDIADKSGNGNNPAWVGANRPTLWKG